MSLAFMFGANIRTYDPAGVIEFYERSAPVRRAFDEAAACTGIPVDLLLCRRPVDGDEEAATRVNSVGLAAGMVGIHDALADAGMPPATLAGLSLGGLVACCLAGALDRRDLFELLAASDYAPASRDTGRREGIAVAVVAPDQDPDAYAAGRDGIFLGADLGLTSAGTARMVMLTGYLDALEEFAAQAPPDSVRIRTDNSLAVHSPLREHARAVVERQLARIALRDPVLPVCSSLDGRMLRTAAEVRDLFLRNNTEPLRVASMIAGLDSHGTRLALAVGPSLTRDLFSFPFPVVHVAGPADLAEAAGARFEFGVATGGVPSRP